MRKLLLILLVATVTAAAETIRLKNGRTIQADTVKQVGDRVEYEIGDNTYRIPKALVARIESGSQPNASLAPAVPDVFGSPSADNSAMLASADVLRQVVRDGRISDEGLEQVARAGNAKETSAAYYMAAQFSFAQGKRNEAQQYLARALEYAPENPAVLTAYAAVLIQAGRSRDAISYVENATRVAPDYGEAFKVLGFAYFNSNRLRDALEAWQRSQELKPDATVETLIGKAKRDLNAETDLAVRSSHHFDLRYEGRQIEDQLRDQLLESLEAAYQELSSQLEVTPAERIAVVLYTEKAFFDVTQAPAWIGAMNDGKLRIPIQGVTSVNAEMSRVLKHELAHSFVRQAAGGRCPTWLNEGIAQLLEPRTLSQAGAEQLAKAYKLKEQIPLPELESSFFQLSNSEAVLAYGESLAAAQYINDSYGMAAVRGILQRLNEGSTMDAALRDIMHADYSQFQRGLEQYLTSRLPD